MLDLGRFSHDLSGVKRVGTARTGGDELSRP